MTAPLPDREAAAEFLDFLHADHEGWACLATNAEHWRQVFFRWPDEQEALLAMAMAQSAQADVYIGMLLHSDRTRKANTALPGHVLWADVDHAFTPAQVQLLQRSTDFRIVKSGSPGHSHLYMLQHQLYPAAELEIRNKMMARHFDADAKWDASTVLRLPGTFNHKGGDLRPVGSVRVCR